MLAGVHWVTGDSILKPQVQYPIGSRAAQVILGDITGDGKPDPAVRNAYAKQDLVREEQP